jgi:type I restriction enzyme, S subunit
MYTLSSLDISGYLTGSTMPKLTQANMNRIPIPVPPLSEQVAIVRILGSLDDKIELNRRINQTLEAMVRAIFKSWLVDFEPVVELLPWTQGTGTIGELARIQKNSLNPADYAAEQFSHYSLPAFDEGMIPRLESGESIRSNKFIVPKGAVLLSKLNPRIPRIWLPMPSEGNRAICSTEFFVVVPKEPSDREFLYSLFSSSAFMERFALRTTGTSGSHQRVRPEDLLRMGIAIPTAAARESYSTTVGPLLSKVAQNREESQTLATLRDTLLPKLLSGEIRVKHAEKIVGEVV